MLDFIMGWILGKNSNKIINNTTPTELILPVEKVEKPKKIRYVEIKELYNISSSLEEAYKVYEDNGLITLYKDGNIYYYLKKEIEEDLIYWGDNKIYDNI